MIADSFQEHNGNTKFCSAEKIIRNERGIFAWSGIHACGQIWLEWMMSGEDKDSRPAIDEETSCIYLSDAGQLWLYNTKCIPMRIQEPYYTIGAGCEFALAALYCDKSPLEAIRVASHFNAFTCPPFIQYDLKSLEPTIYEA